MSTAPSLRSSLLLCLCAPLLAPGCILDEEGLPQDNVEVPETTPIDDLGVRTVDAGPQDAGPSPDAGMPFVQSTCFDCFAGCSCLNTQTESFCADGCGDDFNGCAEGFQCLDIGNDSWFCIPPAASCQLDGLGIGTSCFGNTEACAKPSLERDGKEAHCEGDSVSLGYCTQTCTQASCPNGYECLLGDDDAFVCQAQYLADADKCGRPSHYQDPGATTERPCALDTDCEGGALCIRTEPQLPGVCADRCTASSPCGADQSCTLTERGFACLTERCACHGLFQALGDSRPNLLNEALAQVGLTRCGMIFSVHDWAAIPPDVLNDPYRLDHFARVHNEPLRAPGWGQALVAAHDAHAADASPPSAKAARMVESLALQMGRPAERLPEQDPGTIDMTSPLASAVAALIRDSGGSPDTLVIELDASDIDMELQLALASVIDAMRRAHLARNAAVGAFDASQLYEFGTSFVAPKRNGQVLNVASGDVENFINQVFNYGAMASASADILDAIAQGNFSRFAQDSTSTSTSPAAFIFSQPTPLGRIAIGDAQWSEYTSDRSETDAPWALLLDLGGNDVYKTPVAGNVSGSNSVSVLIDLDGQDQYGYVEQPSPGDIGNRLPSDEDGRYTPRGPPDQDFGAFSFSETPRQGGARAGTAVLVDLGGGNDVYRSLRLSQGSGVFGVGVLVDDGGDDDYNNEAMGQGAGSFGMGLLVDLGGNDVRRAYTYSQGFGFARGGGLLYDVTGDDQYLMDVGDPEFGGDPMYFNAQRPGRANATLGQGFSFGRRADLGANADRAFMSGGLGVLIDGSGDDFYEGSIFAQGGGFWFGSGILADHEGDDRYDSIWYGMGTGAHFALGLLLEGAGNDTYGGRLPRVNVTIGGAHDFTTAFLIDEQGDDVYNGSSISMGTGNLNSFGVLIDNQGNDRYDAMRTYAIGNAGHLSANEIGSPRRKVKTVGVFIDAQGDDSFWLTTGTGTTATSVPFEGVGNNSFWTQTRNMEDLQLKMNERGSGVDSEGESTIHITR